MNEKVLVIGGSGDIGQAIVKEFTFKKAQVISTSSEMLNLNSTQNIKNFFKESHTEFNTLIFAAGQNTPRPCWEIDTDAMESTLTINVKAFVEIMYHLIPFMRKERYGRIVAISSIFGFLSRKGRLSYTVSKHALLGAVRNYAIELAADNILVNAVSPGYIETKLTHKNNSSEQISELKKQIPLGQLGQPVHIAKLITFLCSEDNQYITGQDIVIDGGFSINGFKDSP
jgi:3-oxoacyl-[acyl-carrier protein] reductase